MNRTFKVEKGSAESRPSNPFLSIASILKKHNWWCIVPDNVQPLHIQAVQSANVDAAHVLLWVVDIIEKGSTAEAAEFVGGSFAKSVARECVFAVDLDICDAGIDREIAILP